MPLLDLQRRLRELGRIRIGAQVATKTGKRRPAKLETFRLTSPSKELIEAASELYGGDVAEWKGAPGDGAQYEVFTKASVLEAIVPPGSYMNQHWEMWSGGGCLRRCDGETELLGDRPCLCPDDAEERRRLAAEGKACKPTTRLSLLLPRLPDIGVWRLESHGFYAAVELAGAQQICSLATAHGQMIPVRLRLDPREIRRPGQPTMKFVVPVLEISATFGEVLEALGVDSRAALMPAPGAAGALPAADAEVRAHQLGPSLSEGLKRVEPDGELKGPRRTGRQRRAAEMPGARPAIGDRAFDQAASPDIGAGAPVPAGDGSEAEVVHDDTELATKAQIRALHTLAGKLGWDDGQKHELAGVESFNDLTKDRAGELIDDWQEQLKNRAGAGDTQPIAHEARGRKARASASSTNAPDARPTSDGEDRAEGDGPLDASPSDQTSAEATGQDASVAEASTDVEPRESEAGAGADDATGRGANPDAAPAPDELEDPVFQFGPEGVKGETYSTVCRSHPEHARLVIEKQMLPTGRLALLKEHLERAQSSRGRKSR